jgi:hydroxymethylpyrimidine pyrophosphatase-like HAD family hydrolase
MGDDLRISPVVQTAVQRARDEGVVVALATGRAYESAVTFAEQLDIDTPLVCYQGGMIKDPLSGEVLHRETYPVPLALELIEWVDERLQRPFASLGLPPESMEPWGGLPVEPGQIEVAMFVDGMMYLERVHGGTDFWPRYFGQKVMQVDRLVDALLQEPMKAMLIARPATCDEVVPEFKSAFDGRLQVVRSHPLFIEAVPSGVSKGRSVARLAEHIGISREETIAVGDNENDLTMVEWAGLGVAMGNATPQVKSAADWVAPSVAEDGVAEIVEQFILREAAFDDAQIDSAIEGPGSDG